MSLPETTLTQLQILMQQDPALRAKVQGAADADQAAGQIAAAASANGMAVSEADLKRYFAQASQATPNQALSDAQLEAVAGGFTQDDQAMLIFASIFTLGICCAVVSISQATGGSGMGFEKKYC